MQNEIQNVNSVPEVRMKTVAIIFDYLEILVFSVCAVLLLFTFVIRMCNVSGPSMQPTLYDGEKLLISDLFYTPERGDIVVFHQTSDVSDRFNETIIKRVIAVSGDHVVIDYDQATTTVNGNQIQEEFLPDGFSYSYFRGVSEFIVPDGCVFVMGDNRNNSTDSRSDLIGFLDERRIIGTVVCRLTPFSKFGTLE